ncbi:MAG: beta-lactamase family protein [Cyclobacteriaceae bacterium]|nr:beta-lactamase family protein [Cyclobacteriaceae bacterium]
MKRFLCIIVFVGISISAFAQLPDRDTAVRDLAIELLRVSGMPGISIAISQKGKIVFAEGFGYADVENKIPVTTKTQFRTGSVAKMLTATAVGKLIQQKKLDLSLPVQTYVPYFPVKNYPVSVAQVAGHTAGIPHYNSNDKIEDRVYPSVKDALSVFSHEDLIFEPGTRYNYSTHGYTLLSAVIEGASGMSFLDYMKKEIFTPLSMNSTGPDRRKQEPNNKLAKLYSVKDKIQMEDKNPEEVSYKWAAGGMVSTPSDLVRMTYAYSNGFLSADVVKIMFESQVLKSGDKTRVGIGWRNSMDMDGRKVYEHAGSIGGGRSVVCMFPDDQLSIAIMVNAEWASTIEETAHMIARLFLEKSINNSMPSAGTSSISVVSLSNNGQETTTKGELVLKGYKNMITPDLEKKDVQWPLIFLSGNVYALIRPDGIYYCSVTKTGDVLIGKAIAYGSRMLSSPSSNPAFIKFSN